MSRAQLQQPDLLCTCDAHYTKNVVVCHVREAAMKAVVLIYLTAAGIRELATIEFDSRTSQQPGNAIQKT